MAPAVPKRGEAPALIRALVEKGVDLTEARWVGADLESVFMSETGSIQTPESIIQDIGNAG